ncbi:unnamed protein product [Closterium sp. NIES-65]|nr:unnamed protein product [Closterium sp. NIES-65]
MALARHWGRTLVLPRVRTSRIGATWHAPRVFDPVLMGRFVPCVREDLWRTVVPAGASRRSPPKSSDWYKRHREAACERKRMMQYYFRELSSIPAAISNLSQQRLALHPLHTFLSRASVKLLKTFVASHELHPLPSSATVSSRCMRCAADACDCHQCGAVRVCLTMAWQQEKVVGLGGVLVQRCSALPPSKRARATRAAAADAYCSSHSVLLVRSPCSFSLSTVIANAAAASDAAVDERVWAQPFTAAVFEAPQHLPPFPSSPFAPSPWHALPLPQLASQRLQHLLHVLSSCAEAGKGRTAAEQHTRGLLLAVGAGLAAAGVVTAAAGCGAEASVRHGLWRYPLSH